MSDMFGVFKIEFLKIQTSFIGKLKMMVSLFLIILSILNQKKINRNYMICAKKLIEEMMLFNKLNVHFSVSRNGWKIKVFNFLLTKNYLMKKSHNMQFKIIR
jgi:hypothetical protein